MAQSSVENLKIFVVRANAAVIAPGGFAGMPGLARCLRDAVTVETEDGELSPIFEVPN